MNTLPFINKVLEQLHIQNGLEKNSFLLFPNTTTNSGTTTYNLITCLNTNTPKIFIKTSDTNIQSLFKKMINKKQKITIFFELEPKNVSETKLITQCLLQYKHFYYFKHKEYSPIPTQVLEAEIKEKLKSVNKISEILIHLYNKDNPLFLYFEERYN